MSTATQPLTVVEVAEPVARTAAPAPKWRRWQRAAQGIRLRRPTNRLPSDELGLEAAAAATAAVAKEVRP